MKELLSLSANMMAAYTDDKKPFPMVEVILVTSEPVYSLDASGEITKRREVENLRFLATPQMLQKLAKLLSNLADEADELREPREARK